VEISAVLLWVDVRVEEEYGNGIGLSREMGVVGGDLV